MKEDIKIRNIFNALFYPPIFCSFWVSLFNLSTSMAWTTMEIFFFLVICVYGINANSEKKVGGRGNHLKVVVRKCPMVLRCCSVSK